MTQKFYRPQSSTEALFKDELPEDINSIIAQVTRATESITNDMISQFEADFEKQQAQLNEENARIIREAQATIDRSLLEAAELKKLIQDSNSALQQSLINLSQMVPDASNSQVNLEKAKADLAVLSDRLDRYQTSVHQVGQIIGKIPFKALG